MILGAEGASGIHVTLQTPTRGGRGETGADVFLVRVVFVVTVFIFVVIESL